MTIQPSAPQIDTTTDTMPASRVAAVRVTLPSARAGERYLAPLGMGTPHERVARFEVTGAAVESVLHESDLGQAAALLRAEGGPLVIDYAAAPATTGYPDAVFRPRPNRYTTAGAALSAMARDTARTAGGGLPAIEAIVAHVEQLFTYGHGGDPFEGMGDTVPLLGGTGTKGSCSHIHLYLIAALRAAGFEAGYLYGYFFPAEKGGRTEDMHCWFVTRHDGVTLEWDVAHHLKNGLGPSRPGLNPRPGCRIAIGHSMGHRYESAEGPLEMKLLAEPVLLDGATATRLQDIVIEGRIEQG